MYAGRLTCTDPWFSAHSFEGQSSLTESFSDPSASQSRLKRPLSEERDNCEERDERDSCEGGGQMEVSEGEGLMNKRPRDTSDIRASTACKRPDMNTPLPNEEGVTAIVKVSLLIKACY